MAKISFDGFEAYQDVLARLYIKTDAIIKPAVYEGAEVIADAVKKNLRSVVGEHSTGDLERSMGLSPMTEENGYVHTKLGFEGYDRNGHPNVVKARALESGTSKQQKTPFIRPAVTKFGDEAVLVMKNKVDSQIKKLMEEKE